MALTRKMLAAMDIPAEKVDEIINAHTETVNAIKEERDALKEKIENMGSVEKDLEKVRKELNEANGKIEEFASKDWEGKYNTLKGEYDSFKTETANKETKAKKLEAYKKLLLNAGISEKRIASVIKVSDIESVKLDKDGNIQDADKLTEGVKKEWADFIVTKSEQGANVAKPPTNDGDGGKRPSLAAQMTAQYRNEHYGNPKED